MKKSIRLEAKAISCIKLFLQDLDPKAEAYLFGSRVDENKKGGDIDLLIISSILSNKDIRELRFKLEDLLGEQKIDILYSPNKNSSPFIQVILKKAVQL